MTTFVKKYLENENSSKNYSTAAAAYLAVLDHLGEAAPEIRDCIVQELKDQRSHLKLIASENYSSLAVQLAMGNLLTDKYAEGYAHHRFYAGCENVDTLEDMATNLLKKIFDVDHAYVQPHCGADANLIAFWAVLTQRIQNREVENLGKKSLDELNPEEYEQVRKLLVSQKILGMSLNSGGHLTHGYRHNISAKMFNASTYDINPSTGLLDEQLILQQAKREKPLILLAGYSAYPRLINFAKMREIADEVGAVLMVDMAHFAGLVAGKVLTGEYNPAPYAHIITSTTHKTLRGPRGGIVLCQNEFAEAVNKGCPLVMGGPLPHVIAAKAVAFKEVDTEAFCNYSARVVKNARALGEQLIKRGITLLTGGTDNHLVIADLSSLPITGRQAEKALREAGLTVNRNAIPFDKNGPWYTSGIRIGTPAMTTLGMGITEMTLIADLIADILINTRASIVEKSGQPSKANFNTESKTLQRVRGQVQELLEQFPLYPEIILEY